MITIYFILMFYYIFSFIVEESRLIYGLRCDYCLNKIEKWICAVITTIILIIVAPISFPIALGKTLYIN